MIRLIPLLLLAIVGLLSPSAAGAADEAPIAIDTGKGSQIAEELEQAGPGDKREFTLRTSDNTAALATGDVYRNEQRTYFTVTAISDKGPQGGAFTVQRTAGTAEPGQRLTRVGGSGPQTIGIQLTLLDLYIQGGPFLHPIALLGVVTILLGVNGLLLYRRRRQLDPELVEEGGALLRAGNVKGFAALADERQGLLAVACRAMTDRWRSSSMEDIKERVGIAVGAHINRLRFPVRTLNLISVAAPLLGLLGTIVGMVIVFEGVAGTSGAAKAAVLAAGIRVKLFSTAFALMVALPALFLYFFYNQRVSTLIAESEEVCERFLHRISLLKAGGGAAAEQAAADEDEQEEETDETDEAAESDDDAEQDDAPAAEVEEPVEPPPPAKRRPAPAPAPVPRRRPAGQV